MVNNQVFPFQLLKFLNIVILSDASKYKQIKIDKT